MLVLRARPDIGCWVWGSPQPLMALCGLLALAFYLVTVHVGGGDALLAKVQHSASLDVRYSELFATVSNFLHIVLGLALQLMVDAPQVLILPPGLSHLSAGHGGTHAHVRAHAHSRARARVRSCARTTKSQQRKGQEPSRT